MSSAFWGVIIGGACTLVGGFGGAWWLGHAEKKASIEREAERERIDLIGAITITEYELVENVAWLKGKVHHASGGAPIPLSNVVYRSVQLLLVRGLPPDVSTRLAKAYSMIAVAQMNVQHGIDAGGLSTAEIKDLEGIRDDMETARREIAAHRAGLGAKESRKGKG